MERRLSKEGHNALLDVIEDVHKQYADDVCQFDIDRIFLAAGLPVPDRKVGDKFAMAKNCIRFIDTMCQSGEWKSYVALEAEIIQLKQDKAALQKLNEGLAERVAAQSALLSKRAETPTVLAQPGTDTV